ncbi:MAG TPA: carboxymuconolactone decarboxylase family protein [Solirubrobacteraceae bacterium]|jgi:4-carboxymuconolactone decarboxylase|nr:carboxymuconolactone decarboxylase family protein [Solirubrobacteraceae bacterium]
MSSGGDSDDRRALGREIRGRAQGAKADGLTRALEALDPELVEWTDSFIFGTVWARPGLEFEERMLVAITALASLGQIPQLRNYLFAALQAGIPESKIQESLAMLSVYAGFPAAINALECWREVRAAHGRATKHADNLE